MGSALTLRQAGCTLRGVDVPTAPVSRSMDSIVLSWRELLIAAIVILGVYVAEVLLLLRRGRRRGLGFLRRSAEVAPPSYAIAPLLGDIADLKRQIGELRAEIDSLRARPATEVPTPYASAIQMARSGGAPLEIASTCGISRGEAELISALYRKR